MSAADHGNDAHATASHADPGAGGHDDHGDAHGHEAEPLGPLDVRAWGAAALGIASALVVVAVLWAAIRPA